MADFELPEKPPVFEDVEETSGAEEKKPEKERKSRKKGGAKKPTVTPPAPADEPPEEPEEEPEEEEPIASKTPGIEKPKTLAEALSDYFKKVESGTDFLQRIVSMPEDDELRGSMQLSELERLSGELSQKVIDFFELIETWEKDKKSAKEMGQSSEEFISSHKIPSGCQTAFRTIALFALNKILGPVTETLKSPEKTKPVAPPSPPPPAPATGGTAEGAPFSYRPRSVDEILDELVTGAPTPTPTPTPTGEAPAPGALPAEEAKSRIWNYIPKDSAKTPPTSPGSLTAEVVPPAPKAAPAAAESKPSREWKYIPKGATIPSAPAAPPTMEAPPPPAPAAETAPPAPSAEKVAEAAPIPERIASSWTREKIEALTFENLFELSDEELRDVIGLSRTTAVGWGICMKGMPDAYIKRVRDAYDDPLVRQRQNIGYGARGFDDWLNDPRDFSESTNEDRQDAIASAKEKLSAAFEHENSPQS